jgi:hypothetical protein
MSKRRTADEVTRLLKDADRDLAKGLTVSDFCRKVGVARDSWPSMTRSRSEGPVGWSVVAGRRPGSRATTAQS